MTRLFYARGRAAVNRLGERRRVASHAIGAPQTVAHQLPNRLVHGVPLAHSQPKRVEYRRVQREARAGRGQDVAVDFRKNRLVNPAYLGGIDEV